MVQGVFAVLFALQPAGLGLEPQADKKGRAQYQGLIHLLLACLIRTGCVGPAKPVLFCSVNKPDVGKVNVILVHHFGEG